MSDLPHAVAHDFPQRLTLALQALRAGRPVVVQDDDDRENEADLILAADTLTRPEMARMIRDGSGIVCLCLTAAHARRLGLRPMVENNRSRHGTAFTVSIEAATGVSTGVSAADRVATIRAAVAADAQAAHIVSPGHVFPLVAREGGVLERRGHTEAAVDLARLAGLQPAAVLVELMNDAGEMLRGDAVRAYAEREGLLRLTVDELAQWRARDTVLAEGV
ncbi:3,4-dihydroxy-2-butanone-4-phosphate synthase [uncultured Aquitalea sp.]|uniref:3,4-dihydroxy-2-butanone-4-phosphate synthase n=1 Tax=uncultured Aquitalea sp. TaxID=540272 RepID=UPI0025E1D8BB|nr:3,4-dihydroxy-2-butanone-4-phosphate synthase [uncultured Aquitalea sp.]